MRILVIDGNPEQKDSDLEAYVSDLVRSLERRRHAVSVLRLADMVVADCERCFGCWVRTPGTCLLPDESEALRDAVVQSDLVVFCSPLIMGLPSALTHKALDRLQPLLLPYWKTTRGNVLHEPRYDRMPSFALVLKPEDHIDSEDVSIISEIFAREAAELGSTLAFVRLMDVPAHEVAHEIHRL